jgi:hypothetical protein
MSQTKDNNADISFDIPTVTVNLETHRGLNSRNSVPDQLLPTIQHSEGELNALNLDQNTLRKDYGPVIPSLEFDHDLAGGNFGPDVPLTPELEDNVYHIPVVRNHATTFDNDFKSVSTNQYEIIPHGKIDMDELINAKKNQLLQTGSTQNLLTEAGYPSDQRPLLNVGLQENEAPANDQPQNSLSVKLTDFKALKRNFVRMTKCQKALFIIIFAISLAAYTLILALVLKDTVIPRLRKVTTFKFFCLYTNNISENDTELCFISIAQSSFGIIAIGQIAVGVIVLGQLGAGVVVIAQLGFAVLLTLLAQGTLALFIGYCQFGVGVLYTKGSMVAVSTLQSVRKPKRPYPFNLMCT